MSHTLTSTPAATAAAATVKAWLAASGRSSPDVALTTSERAGAETRGGVEGRVVTRPRVALHRTGERDRPVGSGP